MRGRFTKIAISTIATLVVWWIVPLAYLVARSIETFGPSPHDWGAIYAPYTFGFRVGFVVYVLSGPVVGLLVFRRLGRTTPGEHRELPDECGRRGPNE